MKIYNLHRSNALNITHHDSINFFINRIAVLDSKISINFVHLETDGVIGKHAAPVNQFMIITSGSGTVSSEDSLPTYVYPNQLIFFEANEVHETKSTHGMTAIIIESPDLDDTLLSSI